GGVGAHGDFHIGGAEFKGDVDAAHLAALENDVVGDKCLEAGMRGAQFVAATRQVQDFEVAIFVGNDFASEIGFEVNHADARIDHYGAALVVGGSAQSGNR